MSRSKKRTAPSRDGSDKSERARRAGAKARPAASAPAPDPNDPRAVVQTLAAEGLCVEVVPTAWGGADGAIRVVRLCEIRRALGYRSALMDAMFALQGLGSYPVTLAGTDGVRKTWLPRVARGEAIAAFAMTEAGAGSDVSAIQTRAQRDGNSYVLHGRKTFISNAGLADFYTVFARTSPDGHRGLSAFLVPATTPGVRFVRPIALLTDHPIGEVEFGGCRVPASHRLGAEGDGFSIGMETLRIFRSTVGAAAVGMAERALEAALEHVRERVQFGKPLSEQQAVQMMLAEAATDLRAAWLLVEDAARRVDGGERAVRETSMAKLYATEAAQRTIDAALQLHGARGLEKGAIVESLYRDVRALRIYEGTSEIQKMIIARELLRATPSVAPSPARE